jgi:hypothetical protein
MPHPGWPVAFALTVALESPVYVLATRRSLHPAVALAAALLLNLVTHPLAFWLLVDRPSVWPVRYLVVEAAVWWIEAALLLALSRTRLGRRRLAAVEAIAIALSANALSAGVGLLW